jgi:alpha-beta hydrolase superfamily lysophospholipase
MSEGERLYVEHFRDYVDDYIGFVQHVLSLDSDSEYAKHTKMTIPDGVKLNALPRFIFGHSMGAVVTIEVVLQHADLIWTGAVLSGACLHADPTTATPAKVAAAHFLGRVLPKYRLPDEGFPFLSHDMLVQERALRDPLTFVGPTCRWGAEFLSAMAGALKKAPLFTTPLLVLHGEGDVMALPSGSTEFFAAAASDVKVLHLLPRLYHEILNEDVRDEILDCIVEWCSKLKIGKSHFSAIMSRHHSSTMTK